MGGTGCVCGGFHFTMLRSSSRDGSDQPAEGVVRAASWFENAAAQLCRTTPETIAEEQEDMEPQPPSAIQGAAGKWLCGAGAFHSLIAVPGVGVLTCGTPTEQPIEDGAAGAEGGGGAEGSASGAAAVVTRMTRLHRLLPPSPPLHALVAARLLPQRRRHGPDGSISGGIHPSTGSMRALTHVALPGWDPLVEPIVQIDAGHAHSLAVTSGGRLFSWGSNEFAQLGRGPVVSLDSRTANRAHEPAQVRISNAADGGGESLPVRLVAAGGYHSLLITWSGEVWSFGSNSHGQLARPVLLAEQATTPEGGGGGSTDMSTSHVQPRQVRLPAAARGSSTIAIAAGLRHSVLLLKSVPYAHLVIIRTGSSAGCPQSSQHLRRVPSG